MKPTLILIFILCIGRTLFGQDIQTCIPDGIEFTSQAQIDNFSSDYPECNTILGDVKITGADISSLQGLHQIQTIRGNFEIKNNAQLLQLSGIEKLDSVYGTLNIELNPSLQIVDALDSLKYVGATFNINNNAALITIQGVDNINFIGFSLRIIFNNALVDISGFQKLQELTGNFSLGGNAAIEFVNPLNIKSIQGNCIISDTKVQDLLWLGSLQDQGGALVFAGNAGLIDFTGLASLKYIQGSFIISSNSNLINLSGLRLDSIGTALTINDNSSLQELTGLDSLTIINGNLIIQGNESLKSLLGLDSLSIIRGRITLSDNPILEDINALSQFSPVEVTDITIEDSPLLSECAIESICDYIADGREAVFSNNAIGCNSIEEVSTLCLVGVQYSSKPDEISIFPNPTSGRIFFKTGSEDPVFIRVFDGQGKEILKIPGVTDQVDLSHLKTGLYFLTFGSGNEFLVARVSKT